MWIFRRRKRAEGASDEPEQGQQPDDSCGDAAEALRQLAEAVGISSREANDLVRDATATGRSEVLKQALDMLSERKKQVSTESRQSTSGSSA